MKEYIVGVDAGGTKTAAALYDEAGTRLFDAKSGFGNLLIDGPKAMEHIGAAAAACLAQCPGPARLYVGAAGIHAGQNRAQLSASLARRFPGVPLRIEDDAKLALYAAVQGGDGLLIIAGTGSIAYGKKGPALHRAGGWGNILGDEGSGYDISRKALARVTAEYDLGTGYSLLSRRILEKLDTDVFGLVQFVHQADKGAIAAFLPLVEQCALAGDAAAAALLEEAGASLARLALLLHRRMGFAPPVSVAVKGGVLEKTPAVYQAFARQLSGQDFTLLADSPPAELGAYYLYREEREEETQHGK